jgi:hypothetical protein
MTVLVAIPVMGSYEIGRISLYQWDRTASPDAHFLLIDNSPFPSQYEALFERGFLSRDRWSYVSNPENVGLIRSAQQAYNFALGMEADVLVLTHNDVWVYPPDAGHWDVLIERQFGECLGPEFGVLGLMGSKGCSSSGHRLDTFGSLIEMAGHGRRMTDWIEPAVCLDGLFLACNMKMLREARYEVLTAPKAEGAATNRTMQQGGFDQRYQWHHVYDYDISLTSIELGYRNAVLNIPCHHLSGLTANNAAYATSGPDVHEANYQRWLGKWAHKLGVSVDAEWNYKWVGWV